jgi:hypothetical protein
MVRGPRWVLLAALAAVIGAPACGDANAVYIENDKAGIFVQLPDGWQTYDLVGRDPSKDPSIYEEGGRWTVGFDGAPQPRRANLEAPWPTAPVGEVEAVPFRRESGLEYTSYRALRSTLYQDASGKALDILDPAVREQLGFPLEVEMYDELHTDSHYGVRVTWTVDQGEQSIRTTQLVFIDTNAERLHLLRVRCVTECYDAYAADIESILDSWTLKELR